MSAPPPPAWMVVERAEWESAQLPRPLSASPSPPVTPSAPPPRSTPTFSGYLLKRREHLNFLVEQWRPRWVVIVGRELRYYSTPADAAPRDVIYLAAGTRIEAGGAVKDVGSGGGGGGGGGPTDWPWAIEARGRIVTPIRPDGPFPDARLAVLRIFHPDSPKKVYQFSWFAPPGNDAAALIAREQAQRWAAVLRAAVAGALDPPAMTAARIGKAVVLRSGLKLASVEGVGAATLSSQAQSLPMATLNGTGNGVKIEDRAVEKASGGGNRAGESARVDATTTKASPSPPLQTTPNGVRVGVQASPLPAPPLQTPLATPSQNSGSSVDVVATPPPKTPLLVAPVKLLVQPPPNANDEKCKALVAELQRLSDGDGRGMWIANGSSNGVACWRTTDGSPGARGDARIPYSRAVILATIIDSTERPKYDARGLEGRRVEQIDDNTSIVYLNFKGFPFVSGRDFVLLSRATVDRDGTVWVATGSTVHAATPPRDGIVRAHIFIGGWVLRPVAPGADGIEKECDVTYAMRSDLCGTLPLSITATVTQGQASLTGFLRDYLIKKHGSRPPLLPPPRIGSDDEGETSLDTAVVATAAVDDAPTVFLTPLRQSSSSILPSPPPSESLPAAISPLQPSRPPPPSIPVNSNSSSLPLWFAVALLVIPALYKFIGLSGLVLILIVYGLSETRRFYGRVFRESLSSTPKRTEAAIALRAAAAKARSPWKEEKVE